MLCNDRHLEILLTPPGHYTDHCKAVQILWVFPSSKEMHCVVDSPSESM